MIQFLSSHHIYVASVIATYWFVSISMVYLNKMLMSSDEVSIKAPIFVTWFQCVVTTGICYIAGLLGERTRKVYNQLPIDDNNTTATSSSGEILLTRRSSFYSQFPKAEYNISTAKRILPLSIVFVGMITFNNLCLKYVEVSFYTVARSLTLVFNVIFSYILLHIPTSQKVIGTLIIIVLGFLLGSGGELNFSFLGTSFGICSSIFVSLNSIYTKKVLPAVEDDHWKLTFYNNVNACILFMPIILIFESRIIWTAMGKQLSTLIFWGAMFIAGFFGFSIGIVTVLQIKATSPLTHTISGTAKAAVQSMMAFFIWKNKATFMGVLGIFTVLGGSLAYTMVKMNENKNKFPLSSSTGNSGDGNNNDDDDNHKDIETSIPVEVRAIVFSTGFIHSND